MASIAMTRSSDRHKSITLGTRTSISGDSDSDEEIELPPKRYGLRPELTPKQKIELCDAFGTFDPRGKGIIDSRGFILALRAMTYEPTFEQVDNMIKKVLGTDSKENIDFKSFYQLMQEKMLGNDTKDDVQKAFKVFSDPDTAVITLDNLVAIAEELDANVPIDELQEMITFADINKDGVVSLDEFKKILQRPELE
ncbi:caltractin [Aplysia californica]|uniref:Caltractin n=1 Tax=Aplysia californica TaxID=6500 RepID=A0ABM0JMV4_APLCA|nr:caltractin [Aplysia californica]